MKRLVGAVAFLLCTSATAHELTPTYPKLRPSYIDNVLVTDLKMWNRRNDVKWYEIHVYDEEWEKVPFATTSKIFEMDYLEHKNFEVYIKRKDRKRVEYICTTSKLLKQDVESTGVKSRVCSRVK